MAQSPKTIHVEPGSELDRLLEAADAGGLELETRGVRYRLTRIDRAAGSPWLKELYEHFAPVRQEATDKGYTDEQINAWIDAALAAVRRDQHG
jgi:hypothetical protein